MKPKNFSSEPPKRLLVSGSGTVYHAGAASAVPSNTYAFTGEDDSEELADDSVLAADTADGHGIELDGTVAAIAQPKQDVGKLINDIKNESWFANELVTEALDNAISIETKFVNFLEQNIDPARLKLQRLKAMRNVSNGKASEPIALGALGGLASGAGRIIVDPSHSDSTRGLSRLGVKRGPYKPRGVTNFDDPTKKRLITKDAAVAIQSEIARTDLPLPREYVLDLLLEAGIIPSDVTMARFAIALARVQTNLFVYNPDERLVGFQRHFTGAARRDLAILKAELDSKRLDRKIRLGHYDNQNPIALDESQIFEEEDLPSSMENVSNETN